jgi:D-alanyl-D-alanine carboxypeptidase
MGTPSVRARRAPAIPILPALMILTVLVLLGASLRAAAAPYAAVVMDARTGEVLHSANADTRLHPASLTKMMTLYVAFEAVENGEIGLDDRVLISRKAASEVPSKLGLRAGSRIELRYLIRAAAVKSANDAATAIGEAIEGSEAAFARRMNRTAKALGMTRTTFKNAHGLTEEGHLSTARDMTILGRRLFYDYPEYYNLFSRRATDAKLTTVYNTNRKFLAAYKGADGIKTGYTRAAGFNLVASAERGNERIIATVFGGNSTASRNQEVARLLDLGFRAAPSFARTRKPAPPDYAAVDGPPRAGKVLRVVRAVPKTIRPRPRPLPDVPAPALVALETQIAEAVTTGGQPSAPDDAATAGAPVTAMGAASPTAPARAPEPAPRPAAMTRATGPAMGPATGPAAGSASPPAPATVPGTAPAALARASAAASTLAAQATALAEAAAPRTVSFLRSSEAPEPRPAPRARGGGGGGAECRRGAAGRGPRLEFRRAALGDLHRPLSQPLCRRKGAADHRIVGAAHAGRGPAQGDAGQPGLPRELRGIDRRRRRAGLPPAGSPRHRVHADGPELSARAYRSTRSATATPSSTAAEG